MIATLSVRFAAVFVLAVAFAAPTSAQRLTESGSEDALAIAAFDGAPPPVPPAVATRDERGRVTLRASRLERPLEIDGRLDDEIYVTTLPIEYFEQQVPRRGRARPPKKPKRGFSSTTTISISPRACFDEHPERIVANELRHDSVNIFNGGDSMTLVLDTFYDHRNGFLFQTNPLGAQREQAIADGQYIESWNTVWQVRSRRASRAAGPPRW